MFCLNEYKGFEQSVYKLIVAMKKLQDFHGVDDLWKVNYVVAEMRLAAMGMEECGDPSKAFNRLLNSIFLSGVVDFPKIQKTFRDVLETCQKLGISDEKMKTDIVFIDTVLSELTSVKMSLDMGEGVIKTQSQCMKLFSPTTSKKEVLNAV